MRYTTSIIDSSTEYAFIFDDNTRCKFFVNSGGVIYIDIKERISYDFLCSALNEITNIVIQKGLNPKININNSTTFLKVLVKKCGYKKLPAKGVSFSVWVKKDKTTLEWELSYFLFTS